MLITEESAGEKKREKSTRSCEVISFFFFNNVARLAIGYYI